MRIGILQSGHFLNALGGEHDDYDVMFERMLSGYGFTFQTWNVVDMEFPTGPDDAEGWMITGSRHGAYEDHPFIAPLEDLIRSIVAAGRPLVGICFGHQIIAQALGGRVEKFEQGWGAGLDSYDFSGAPIQLNAWHQDQVVDPPEGAAVLARSEFCEFAALLYGDRALTLQAHPEFDNSVVEALIEKRGPELPAQTVEAARAKLETANDNETIADHIAAFLKAGHG